MGGREGKRNPNDGVREGRRERGEEIFEIIMKFKSVKSTYLFGG